MDQLNALAGKGDWFGEGSRIIITSRDRHLLTSHDKNYVYQVKTLEDNEARYLFGQHAFTNSNKVEIRRDLIDGALHYAGGLPLALEVLGSFLRERKEPEWESTLHKLSKIPESKIDRVLKISFNGLDEKEREIFLDIACFFKGKSIKDIQEVLDSCDFDTTIGIEILIERSLIKNEWGYLQMHDLVQLMGRNIVKQECRDDPGKRSRLWLLEDVQNVLYEDMVMDAVEAIVLNLCAPEKMTISPGAFANMKSLRILILRKVHISSQGPVRLPKELRWLEWPNSPDLEFVPGLKKLVRLHFKNSNIKQLGGNCQNFICLKSIEFLDCKSLASVPDLSSAPLLESIYLLRCKSLVEVHQSVGDLDKLKHLTMAECSNLRIFPNTLNTKSLQMLRLNDCFKLEKCPDILGKMEHLEYFDLRGTAIKEVPASIENLVSVKTIDLGFCKNLTRLPSNIHKLKNLESLYLSCCSNLAKFPKNLEDSIDLDADLFSSLKWLDLQDCDLSEAEFLENASSCPKLRHLDLANNKFTHLPTCFNKYDHWKDLFVYSFNKYDRLKHLMVYSMPYTLSEEVEIVANGSEMPEWILPCEEDSISFMVPPDLCDKFLGLAVCFILGQHKKNPFGIQFDFSIFVNGKIEYRDVYLLVAPLESDHVRLVYIPRGEEKLLENDWSHIQVCFRTPKGSIKKRGFRLICEQEEDDLRVRFPTLSADGNELEFQGRILEGRHYSEEFEYEDRG